MSEPVTLADVRYALSRAILSVQHNSLAGQTERRVFGAEPAVTEYPPDQLRVNLASGQVLSIAVSIIAPVTWEPMTAERVVEMGKGFVRSTNVTMEQDPPSPRCAFCGAKLPYDTDFVRCADAAECRERRAR